MKICIDYGHGGKDPGATYKGRLEKDDVLAVGKAITAELRRHGVAVDETRTSDATVSLQNRSNFENKKTYDYFISFHRNAFKPEAARGAETYTYLNGRPNTKSLAKKINDALVAVGFVNRGVKEANFHVLRETKAPAILTEIGFIDNTGDNGIFDNKRNAIVRGITKAILSQLGIAYKEKAALAPTPPPTSGKLYRVQIGAYSVKANAEAQLVKAKKAGFKDAFIAEN